jgi:hypothetical protein
VLNAPFSHAVGAGSQIAQTVTYMPSNSLPSIAVADYWDPSSALQRLIHGAAVDRLELRVNGDFHEFTCSGPAADIIDTGSFETGQGGLSAFPDEPPISGLLETPIPGHLGQIWLGISPTRMCTILDAAVVIRNNVDLRAREFGSLLPRCMVPGQREVRVSFSLYERDDEATTLLYQAARQRTPVSIMMQLGEAPGQLCGVYVPSFIPEVPVYSDSEARVSWKFSESQAQGGINDEIAVAFA